MPGIFYRIGPVLYLNRDCTGSFFLRYRLLLLQPLAA
jgi:hypothetical protein